MAEHPSDLWLLERWRGGDARAGEQLVRRHSARLLRFFANKVGAGAEDLCQQTWASCIEARDRIDDDGGRRSFASYLFAAARNRLFNFYRDQQRHADRFDPLVTTVAQLTGGTSSQLAVREDRRRLHAALQSLPLDAQIALELHYWEHLSVREIGDALGVPEGTIKARLFRARAQLHALLHDAPAG
ncbi:MAG: sigma-70 family RNA polymerase sigma factor [Deltaproteobacteria bacterium]|jgi:RNA polymerase sigma factor (sigma-70 family)|nr:sigma-70 family RNA polymerase sigma factor [Deltaproteobacteria bacterium]MBK8238289.1 sigma-70 family RNA polymerase sigma factor [Deltaproteobacteria bacterium]MBP7291057.1 sigma-70 family RNA polymerase sigma factor [Nannocystaceae bacterium]